MHGDLALALHGIVLAAPRAERVSPTSPTISSPARSRPLEGTLTLNAGREPVELVVTNRGDRPIQVGSHYPFERPTRALDFDRALAAGRRLDIPAGTAVRFEPGDEKRVRLDRDGGDVVSLSIDRRHYADMFGPTTGDRVRLGDTELWATVERDFAVYGDECKFGGGKVLRDGQGQRAGVDERRRARRRHHQRARRRLRPASTRPTSGSRTDASPASARRATPTSWPA